MHKKIFFYISLFLLLLLINPLHSEVRIDDKILNYAFQKTGFDAKSILNLKEIKKIEFNIGQWRTPTRSNLPEKLIKIYQTEALYCDITFKSGLEGYIVLANFKTEKKAKDAFLVAYSESEGYKENFFNEDKLKNGYLITNNHKKLNGTFAYMIYKNCVMLMRFGKINLLSKDKPLLLIENKDLVKLDEIIKAIINIIDTTVK